MQPIVMEALKLIKSTIPTTIDIKMDIQPDCGMIKADPTQIHQIVMNLSANAFHAMEDTGGKLKVSLKEIELGTFDLMDPNMIPGTYACLVVVDDEAAILALEKQMLDRLGYKVASYISSQEALEAFKINPDQFELIITDMAMPKMSGDKLTRELTRIRPDIPVLLCSGFSETMSEEKIADLGIKNFLLKPIVMKTLAHKIREALDKK